MWREKRQAQSCSSADSTEEPDILCAGMSICAKLAGRDGIPVFEIVLVRSAIVTAFAAAKLWHDHQPGEPLLGHRRWLLLVRGMCGFGAGR